MALGNDWHLDKRVNVSIIGALLIQAAVIGVSWGVLNEKVSQIEKRLDTLAVRSQETDKIVAQQGEEIATLTVEIRNLTRQLDRMLAQSDTTNDLLRQLITRDAGR